MLALGIGAFHRHISPQDFVSVFDKLAKLANMVKSSVEADALTPSGGPVVFTEAASMLVLKQLFGVTYGIIRELPSLTGNVTYGNEYLC